MVSESSVYGCLVVRQGYHGRKVRQSNKPSPLWVKKQSKGTEPRKASQGQGTALKIMPT